ncbi:LysR family transcriptional regulator [Pseudonocardia sp. MH-G8]|uniref:LysR family transcriptional regulator n=1 Tax=Pseudonocardia sp. MH-G8 TaxID=1854588 RepID=UPI0026A33076
MSSGTPVTPGASQVLCPAKKNVAGTIDLSLRLQERLSPSADDKPETYSEGAPFRLTTASSRSATTPAAVTAASSTAQRHEIEVFLTLAEELHFGRTGERLGISQGRVSQTVQRLERRFGLLLFQRTSRRVAITPAGARFR